MYRDSDASVLWSTNTQDRGANRLCMQKDGNLVIYDANNNPNWASKTRGSGFWFKVKNDGNAVIFGKDQIGGNKIIWTTGIQGRSCYD